MLTEEQARAESAHDDYLLSHGYFPTGALGEVMGAASTAIQEKTQCRSAMAGNSVLAAASLAAQAVANVKLPHGKPKPLSLFILTIAESGDRKTAADEEAMAPVRLWENDVLAPAYKKDTLEYRRKSAAWKSTHDKILQKQGTSVSDMLQTAAALEAIGPQPVPPPRPHLTFGDATQEGLLKAYKHHGAALGIFNSEGGIFLAGHGFSPDRRSATGAALSSLWDGSSIDRLRADDNGNVNLKGRRLAMHMMVQPDIADDFLDDPILKDQGLFGRLLMAAPKPLAGELVYTGAVPEADRYLRAYFGRMRTLLESARLDNEGNPLLRELTLTEEAQCEYAEYFNEVEHKP
jgi:hypothetical protein